MQLLCGMRIGKEIMGFYGMSKITWAGGLVLSSLLLGGCSLPEPPQAGNTIPAEYANTHMPEGWWTDEAVIEEGRQLYLGMKKSDVNCGQCHGATGKPVRSGARNFQDASTMKKYSDSHLLWRISEGVPFSTMGAYKGKLSEDQIWKVIAFLSTLGMDGFQYDPNTESWVPSR